MKTTWILGAGASISHTNGGFPSIDGFFAKAKELGITTLGRRRVRPEFLALADYVRTRFGKSILRKSDFINIETLLTLLDIDFRSSGK